MFSSIKKLNLLLTSAFGVGCICNNQRRKLLDLYNITLALFLCSLGVALYLEKKFLYTGIFATCLQFVQYYLMLTHVFYTIIQTTLNQKKYRALLGKIGRVARKFEKNLCKKVYEPEKILAVALLAFYSAISASALFFPDQFVSCSCWISLYLTTMISVFYVSHLVNLLGFAANALGALNESLEALDGFPSTVEKIAKCWSLSKVDFMSSEILIMHKVVSDLAKNVLQLATVSVAVLLLTGCFAYSVLLYKTAMYFISSIQVRRSQWSTLYMLDCQTLVLFAEIYALVRSSESVTMNANRIAVVLHKLKNIYPDFGGSAFNAHSMKLLNQKLRLTLSGVFVLDRSLLVGILVSFGTLVVISLQCDEDFLVTNPKTLLMLQAFNKSF